MPDSASLRRLRQLRADISHGNGKLDARERKNVVVTDTDGKNVPLTDQAIVKVLDRRIAAEEAKGEVAKTAAMQEGQRVEVRMHGDDTGRYVGTVIDAGRMWVQLDPEGYPAGEFIADESSIAEWRAVK